MVIKGRLGKLEKSPYLAISKDTMAQMQRMLGEFGMTPASRSRIPRETLAPKRRQAAPAATEELDPWSGDAEVDPRSVLSRANGAVN